MIAAAAALLGGGLLCAAILVPAPAAALPLLGLVCVGLPMLAAWELARTHVALGGLGLALRRGGRSTSRRSGAASRARAAARDRAPAGPLIIRSG